VKIRSEKKRCDCSSSPTSCKRSEPSVCSKKDRMHCCTYVDLGGDDDEVALGEGDHDHPVREPLDEDDVAVVLRSEEHTTPSRITCFSTTTNALQTYRLERELHGVRRVLQVEQDDGLGQRDGDQLLGCLHGVAPLPTKLDVPRLEQQ
jgi:hypothetical protein